MEITVSTFERTTTKIKKRLAFLLCYKSNLKNESSSCVPYTTSVRDIATRAKFTQSLPKSMDKAYFLLPRKMRKHAGSKHACYFVRAQYEGDKSQVGKKDWAFFGTKDTTMSASKILELYAMRFRREVYFKFATPHLGLLSVPTETFASHVASIHLTAIRYLIVT
ncbi:MAG: hypothetical protein DRR16_27245 [Candidatus Parabeggiatoa sp. nov. 3]|nr:MAG: hypothetical protein DRR00_33835 [Gammaproteobacteria bacterium]RKZ55437.1 MAG: hypothetical protein DRQ99_30010 [Gammaproteobacteria bacterium]RKZ78659.1 MAG: hypothetical protein DRR16_27245 [Gammaproteobacteria bacterium]